MGRRMFLKRAGTAGVATVILGNYLRVDVSASPTGITRKYLVCVVEPESWNAERNLFVDNATGEKIDKSSFSFFWRRALGELTGSGARKGDIAHAFNISATSTVTHQWLKTSTTPPSIVQQASSTAASQAITHNGTTILYTPNPASSTGGDETSGKSKCRVEIKDAVAAGLATVSSTSIDIGTFEIEWGPVKWTSPNTGNTEVSMATTTLDWGFVLMDYQEYLNWCSALGLTPKPEPQNAPPPTPIP